MGLKYSSFAIRGIDVSQFNGLIDWSKVQANFSGIRVGYGNTLDSKFNVFQSTLPHGERLWIKAVAIA